MIQRRGNATRTPSSDGTRTIDGHSYLVLDLTKKIHSTILTRTLAFVDPTNYQLARMEWDYTNGGMIVMDQTYRSEDGFSLVSTQHATIQIPHIHAVADATLRALRNERHLALRRRPLVITCYDFGA